MSVHIPEKPAPKPRRKALFFDRVKLLLVLAILLGFMIMKQHADYPMEGWGTAISTQLRAKSWMLWVAAFEVIRQVHYLICENSVGYNDFWVNKFFGGWDRFWSRRNPWFRYRMQRLVKTTTVFALLTVIASAAWKLPLIDTISEAPGRVWRLLFSQEQGLPFIFQIIFMMFFAAIQIFALFWAMSRGGIETLLPDEVSTRFADVWGQDRVVQKIKENILFLEKPAEIESKGGYVPSGILLWGPPGTGKTLLAKAVAGETGNPFVFVEPGAFNATFVGIGPLKVKLLFRKLRKLSLRHGGTIVFFDEADVLGNRGMSVAGKGAPDPAPAAAFAHSCNGRHYVSAQANSMLQQMQAGASAATREGDTKIVMGGMGMGAGSGALQGLLTELSGLEKPRGWITRRLRKFLGMPGKKPPKYRILIMMATNVPDALDAALLRPGRIDRIIRVGYPSLEGRKDTYRNYLKKVANEITEDQVERISLMHPNGTGAEIQDIVNEALIIAMRDKRSVVSWQDLISAKTLKTHGMPDEVHPMALERHAVALHEASHAIAMKRLKKRHAIDVATIEPRGSVGGFVSPVPTEEPGFPWRYIIERDVMTFMASLAGERHFYEGDNSVGVGGDLRSSTLMVSSMFAGAAMGERLSSLGTWGGETGDHTKVRFNEEVEHKLQGLYADTQKLVAENHRWIMAIAHALEQHHTISGDDIDAILNGTQGPLVNGAWYHTDGFMMAYEHYHAAALSAHQNQTKLAVPLPTAESVYFIDTAAARQPAFGSLHAGAASGAAGAATMTATDIIDVEEDDSEG